MPHDSQEMPRAVDPRPPSRPASNVVLLMTMLLMAAVIWQIAGARRRPLFDPGAEPRPVTPRGDLAESERTIIEIFRQTSPSVVHISPAMSVAVQEGFRVNILKIPQGAGTGFIWDESGHIVTNDHVIGDASEFQVTLADRSVWSARLVGRAPEKDLVVLRIDAPERRLLPILVGSSVDLVVGQNVLAIGNPFGLDQSLTTGVISGLGREIETEESSTRSSRPIQDVIQTDAAINPGNSGGPLLDSAGRLIGVNTSIVSPSGVYAGVGFAIPVDVVNDVVTQIIRHGKFMRPGFGVKVLTDAYAREWGIQGVLVTEVMPLSSAAEAGLRATVFRGGAPVDYGDIIIGLDGEKVESERDLYKMLDRRKVGDWVTLRVHRASGDEDVRIRLQGISPEG